MDRHSISPCETLAERYQALLEVTEAISVQRDLSSLIHDLAQRLHRVVNFEYMRLILHDPERNVMRLHVLEAPNERYDASSLQEMPVDESPGGWVWRTQESLVVSDVEKETRFPRVAELMRLQEVKSFCAVPLTTARRRLGALGFGSRQTSSYGDADLEFLNQVAKQVAVAVDNALAYQQITELKDKLTKEKLYLEDEIRTEYNFDEIVGESGSLKRALKQAETVAPTDSTVLIQGETGTGKELIARAIHNLSDRRERTFVKINCAAIPTGLLESELFGHERGAFTGAIARKIGRFELAHQGTLFLDEIGDVPLELQSKLLRVLQEREFERLGSTKTVKVDVRLVSATNRDLARMVADKAFRSDLYYRLNVFPITVPSLRERPEDIPLLVRYFTQKYARRMNKEIEAVPAGTMTALSRYPWPGNIRELENLIERSVILSPGPELRVSSGELKGTATPANDGNATLPTLEDAERSHILRALRETNWVIGGPSGAAARLGMKRTTLQSKVRKLGISRPS
jgi:formate hydrogenlyase transcriptional activator